MVFKPQKLALEIPQQIGSYKTFIDACCDFVGDFEPLASDFKRLSKFKLVIMELLTNAIKHHNEGAILELETQEDHIIIKKTDKGRPFIFTDAISATPYSFPLTGIDKPKRVQALLGNNYKMDILIKGDNLIEFLEIPEVDYLSIQEVPENFGLLVIRKCVTTFHYQFNTPAGENTFELMLKF